MTQRNSLRGRTAHDHSGTTKLPGPSLTPHSPLRVLPKLYGNSDTDGRTLWDMAYRTRVNSKLPLYAQWWVLGERVLMPRLLGNEAVRSFKTQYPPPSTRCVKQIRQNQYPELSGVCACVWTCLEFAAAIDRSGGIGIVRCEFCYLSSGYGADWMLPLQWEPVPIFRLNLLKLWGRKREEEGLISVKCSDQYRSVKGVN